jgi:hypothetical protein
MPIVPGSASTITYAMHPLTAYRLSPRTSCPLAAEPNGDRAAAGRLGQFRMKHLECHRPVVAEIVGEIHHRHATAAELALDTVLAGECSLKATQSIFQRVLGEVWPEGLQR